MSTPEQEIRLLVNEEHLQILAEELARVSNVSVDEAKQKLLDVYFALYPKSEKPIEEKTKLVPNRSDRRKNAHRL